MRKNPLNGNVPYEAKIPKTDFDMSQSFGFSSSTGMILPVYQDLLNAGESVYYSGNLFSRSQPLVTAAMADVDVYLDWFFVPAQMLLLGFGSARYLTNDLISSGFQFDKTKAGQFPLCNIEGSFVASVNHYSMFNNSSDLFGQRGEDNRFDCRGLSSFRLANHLGFNPYGLFTHEDSYTELQHTPDNPNVFPVFALAYHAIWQDYFRVPLDDRILREVGTFNWDSRDNSGGPSDGYVDWQVFRLHYRPMNMDYFTSVKTSPIGSGINLSGTYQVTGSDINITGIGLSDESFGGTLSYRDLNDSNYLGSSVSGEPPSGLADISAQDIRGMFAIDKLLRITGRAKKDYDSQILAHFGFKVPHDVKHEITHLGVDRALLHIGEVTSMADTYTEGAGSALGEISGKGYVNIQGKKRKFVAPCDGVFMCTYSCVPRPRYHGTFDKLNVLTNRFDLFTPELDRLGRQPLYVYEAECGVAGSSSNRVGWQYRYEQHKRKYDRVTEAFAKPVAAMEQVNQYSAWMLGRLPYAANSSIVPPRFDDFLCTPSDLNQIMVMPYDTTWHSEYVTSPWLMFARDPFINDFFANVKKVSTMTRFGEPVLD